MGLDMYLYAVKTEFKGEYYCSPRGTKLSIEYPEKLKQFIKGEYFGPTVEQRTEYKIGYWRKANQIHKFFTDLVGGKDDCRPIPVSLENLEDLLSRCYKIMENHDWAKELLPTKDGFFFGDTEYDEYYFDDIQYTIDQIEPVVKLLKEQDEEWERVYNDKDTPDSEKQYPELYDIEYCASW